MAVDPEKLVKRFYNEVWNRADEYVAREILHDAFRFRGSLGQESSGADGFIEYMRAVHVALDGYTCTIEELLVDGYNAAARMTFNGRHRGDLFGVAATGREIVWSGAAFFRTDGTHITELWVLGDVDAVKRQVGAPASAAFTSS